MYVKGSQPTGMLCMPQQSSNSLRNQSKELLLKLLKISNWKNAIKIWNWWKQKYESKKSWSHISKKTIFKRILKDASC